MTRNNLAVTGFSAQYKHVSGAKKVGAIQPETAKGKTSYRRIGLDGFGGSIGLAVSISNLNC